MSKLPKYIIIYLLLVRFLTFGHIRDYCRVAIDGYQIIDDSPFFPKIFIKRNKSRKLLEKIFKMIVTKIKFKYILHFLKETFIFNIFLHKIGQTLALSKNS